MIAPLRETESETSEGRRRLRRARQKIASALFEERPQRADHTPPVPAWQAWLFVAWVVVAGAAYAASMLGLW